MSPISIRLLDYNPDPFGAPGEWIRANLHAHSTGSDGKLTPEQLRDKYRDEGYGVLCITDHNVITPTDGLSDDRILVLPGAELNPMHAPSDHASFHLVGINITKPIHNRELTPSLVFREVNEQGGVGILAHPAWGGHNMMELLGVEGFVGIEVYNHLARKSAQGESSQIWDQMLEARGPIWGVSVDDIHGPEGAFGGWTWIKARERTVNAVAEALCDGLFYASNGGPLIKDFRVELVVHDTGSGKKRGAWKVSAHTGPAQRILFVTNGDWGRLFEAEDDEHPITQAERVLSNHAHWVRLEVLDARGRKSWSNPLMVPSPPVVEE